MSPIASVLVIVASLVSDIDLRSNLSHGEGTYLSRNRIKNSNSPETSVGFSSHFLNIQIRDTVEDEDSLPIRNRRSIHDQKSAREIRSYDVVRDSQVALLLVTRWVVRMSVDPANCDIESVQSAFCKIVWVLSLGENNRGVFDIERWRISEIFKTNLHLDRLQRAADWVSFDFSHLYTLSHNKGSVGVKSSSYSLFGGSQIAYQQSDSYGANSKAKNRRQKYLACITSHSFLGIKVGPSEGLLPSFFGLLIAFSLNLVLFYFFVFKFSYYLFTANMDKRVELPIWVAYLGYAVSCAVWLFVAGYILFQLFCG